MRIGINCVSVKPSYLGGVNTFTLGLLGGLSRVGGSHQFQLYINSANASLWEKYRALPNFRLFVLDEALKVSTKAALLTASTTSESIFEWTTRRAFAETARTMESQSDLIYTPTTIQLPLILKKPTVLSMHDVQHVHFPQFFSLLQRMWRSKTFALSARHASFVQASSRYIRSDLLKQLPELRPERVTVIHEGVDIQSFQTDLHICWERLAQHALPSNFIYYPAQLWPHKDHLTVLQSLLDLKARTGLEIPLILTGAKFSASNQIFRFIRDHQMSRVFYLGKVSWPEVVALYRCARLVITASLYESSSLCILEAAASGTPIVAARTPPNVEMGENIQTNFFEPKNPASLCKVVEELWNNEGKRREQSERNRRSVNMYSWDETARNYLPLFEYALRGPLQRVETAAKVSA